MKKVIRSSLYFILIGILFACGSVRLTETQSVGKTPAANGVFENEDLRVTYDFWGEHGLMYFTIYNKSQKPVYIDWKKSVFIHNHWKNDYWVEKTSSESITVPIGDEESRSFKSVMSTVTAERITFLPPDCYASVPMTFEILDHLHRKQQLKTFKENKIVEISDDLRWDENSKREAIQKPNGKGTVKAYTLNYTKENSPYRFRNFLTYSTDEKFTTEKRIDNEFYVSRFVQMGAWKFFGKAFTRARPPRQPKIGRDGRVKDAGLIRIYDSPFRKRTTFYKTL